MIRRIGFSLLAIVAVLVGLMVGTLNADKVALDLLWVQLEWPLGLVLLCAFAFGLLIGLLAAYLTQVVPLRLRLRKARSAGLPTTPEPVSEITADDA